MRHPGLALVVMLALVVGDSCSNSPTAPVIASLTVSPDTLHLHHGDTQLLNVAALDGSGHAVTGASLSFSSADTSVAAVSGAGLVTARKAGNATITVSSGNAHQTVLVLVLAGAKAVQASPADTTIHLGGAYALSVTVLDSANLVIAGAPVVFASLDTTLVRVTPAGAVSGVGVGTTHVSATSGAASVFVNVRVIDTLPTSRFITATPTDTTLPQGKSYQLNTVVSDSTHAPIPNAVVHYMTSDGTVASVTGGGLVMTIARGSAIIRVQSESVFVLDTVRVTDSSIVASPAVTGSPFGIAATPGGAIYVTRHTDNALSRFTLPSTTLGVSVSVDPNPAYVAFDSAGATAYVTSIGGNRVQVLTVSTNTVTDSIAVTSPLIVKVSPDDKSIFVTTGVDTLYQIDRATKAVIAAFPTSGAGNSIAFNPANDSMMYIGTQGSQVNEVNYRNGTNGRSFTPGGTTQGVVVSLDGSTLYVANEGTDRIDAITLATGVAAAYVSTSSGGAFDLQLSPDGTKLWASLSSAGVVDEYDRVSLTRIRSIRTLGAPRRIAVTSGSTFVLVANEAGWVDFIK